MAPPGPRIMVDSPGFTPARFGLLSSATLVGDLEDHWENGVKHQPFDCADANIYVDVCPPDERPAKEVERGTVTVGSDPFTVYAVDACSSGGRTYAEARERAGAALANGEGRALEWVFWTGGDDDIRPHLADNAETLVNGVILQRAAQVIEGDDLSIAASVARLEKGLGECYGGVGVIHMDRGQSILALGAGLLEVSGERLLTKLGTRVAAGGGYTGQGPGGNGIGWMYATGAIAVRRSAVSIDGSDDADGSLDTAVNNRVVVAERTYTITWDCCLLATQGPDVEAAEEA